MGVRGLLIEARKGTNQMQTETFIAIADVDQWEAFVAANVEALEEIADIATCLALALNCNLIIGGGAAPLFRVGFVDA